MRKYIFLTCFTIISVLSTAQNAYNTKDIKPEGEWSGIWSKKISSDSLSSAFVIWVEQGKDVKLHMHKKHTEHVYVLEGGGDMQLGDEYISIVEGDVVVIPMGTPHSLKVTSRSPIKIISVQSPEFLGKDRIFID